MQQCSHTQHCAAYQSTVMLQNHGFCIARLLLVTFMTLWSFIPFILVCILPKGSLSLTVKNLWVLWGRRPWQRVAHNEFTFTGVQQLFVCVCVRAKCVLDSMKGGRLYRDVIHWLLKPRLAFPGCDWGGWFWVWLWNPTNTTDWAHREKMLIAVMYSVQMLSVFMESPDTIPPGSAASLCSTEQSQSCSPLGRAHNILTVISLYSTVQMTRHIYSWVCVRCFEFIRNLWKNMWRNRFGKRVCEWQTLLQVRE